MEIADYIPLVKRKLSESSIVNSFAIVDERILFDRGYFRARVLLTNGDFLEIAEAFTSIDQRIVTISYRYQWMDASKQKLRKRWDNVEHFPDLPNFPDHVHVGDELNVQPGESRNILQIITVIEREIEILWNAF
ncbi:conserved hypothetical protein [Microcystis aeruginosa PCC 7941]|nr:conserved hypothetical protein [Microcystis aeruginosa PCC 7941]